MRLSTTLSLYIGRLFLLYFTGILLIFLCLILMFDTVELIRRSASETGVSVSTLFEMALMKLPHMGQEIFPFAVLFGGMATFARLTRSHELVVTRAAGVSVWQFLLPVLGLAFLLGVLKIGVFNPIASAALATFERMEAVYLEGQPSELALSKSGLWLRQASEEGQSVIHAQNVLQQGVEVELRQVIVFMYEGSDTFARRIDAGYARLEDGFWHLRDAWILTPEAAPLYKAEYWLETDLTLGRIQDSFASPETMSFWSLPGFIDTLEEAGFSAVRHRLHWHALLAAPLLMCAMILIAATFSLRHVRAGGTAYIIIGGVITGFLLYFFSNIVFALGLSDSIPVTLAAWSPSGVSTLLGLAMLLHLEDG